MQKTFKLAGWFLSALMATVFPSSSDAGLKYWTTGNYDPATVRLTWLPEPLGMVIIVQ